MAELALERITKRYRRKTVLSEVTLGFAPGLALLLGPSGAGKSTLLRIIATAERANAGQLRWNGVALPSGRRALRRVLGYAPQAVDLPETLTASEFAMHMAALKGLATGPALRQFAAITDAIGLHADINNRIATFSGGMRRRLIFAQALLGAPELIALDEPTAELDADTARRVDALILERARDAIVITTTHLSDTLAPHARLLRVMAGEVVVE